MIRRNFSAETGQKPSTFFDFSRAISQTSWIPEEFFNFLRGSFVISDPLMFPFLVFDKVFHKVRVSYEYILDTKNSK